MVTAVSAAPTLHAALADVASRVLASLGGGGCTAGDLAIVFVSSKYGEKMGRSGRQGLDSVVPKLRSFLPGLVHVIGTTADGVVGAIEGGARHEEVQERPGVSLSLLRMGAGVRLTPFTVMIDDLPGLDASASRWQRLVGGGKPLSELDGGERPLGEDSFLIFADPSFHSSGHLSKLLQGLDFGFPSAPKVGSLSSIGALGAGGSLICTLPRDVLTTMPVSALHESAAVGVRLSGDITLDAVKACSCKPVGPTFEVVATSPTDPTVITEMSRVGAPISRLSASGHVRSLIDYGALPADAGTLEQTLYLGVAADEFVTDLAPSDFVIRRIVHVDASPMTGTSSSGAAPTTGMAMVEAVRPGQRVRFFLRDRLYAAEALDKIMRRYKRAALAASMAGVPNAPLGVLMLASSRRGRGLFGEISYESRTIEEFAPGVPIGGLFGGGQLAPLDASRGEGTRIRGLYGKPSSGQFGSTLVHNGSSVLVFLRRVGSSVVEPEEPAAPGAEGGASD